MTGPAADAAPAKGAIYDLGYARYAGERLPPSTLWRVIMRQQLSHAWKTMWRYKLWLIAAIVITGIGGTFMYVQRSLTFGGGLRRGGGGLSYLDGMAFVTFRFYRWVAFIVSLTVTAPIVARDEQTGAFTFYFARPVRAIDYVIGKLAASLILMATITLAGPLALCIFRVALSDTTSEALRQLEWLPKVILPGGLLALALASMSLAASSLANRRAVAFGLWTGYYVVFTTVLVGIGLNTWKPLAAVDVGVATQTMISKLFDVRIIGEKHIDIPLWASIPSLVLQSGLAIWILVRRVSGQARGAVGGSS